MNDAKCFVAFGATVHVFGRKETWASYASLYEIDVGPAVARGMCFVDRFLLVLTAEDQLLVMTPQGFLIDRERYGSGRARVSA
eukprot:5653466-Prymnesium_polylepis.1